jgi:integrase
MVNRDYLKPAAIAAGVIRPGERFGFHLLRHSLSTWVNKTTKDVKMAQTLLRHSKPDLTAHIYIHSVPKENLKAQERYVRAMMKGNHSSIVTAEPLASAKPASMSIQ